MDELRQKYATAIERFGHHYEPHGLFDLPTLQIGEQGFSLDHTLDDEDRDEEHREWLGIMLCAALERLVQEHKG